MVGSHYRPAEAGRTLMECALRKCYGVTVVGVKRAGQEFIHATPETTLEAGDLLVISGTPQQVEAFAAAT